MRDSKDPDGSVLVVPREKWTAFLLTIQDGQFNLQLRRTQAI